MCVFVGIILYILIGIIRVLADFRGPYFSQPMYVAQRRWDLILIYVLLLWPLLIASDMYWFLLRFKRVDTSTTENDHKAEPTGISKLRITENEIKDKQRQIS